MTHESPIWQNTAIGLANSGTEIGAFVPTNYAGLQLTNFGLFDELFGGMDYIDVVDDSTIAAPLTFEIT